MVENWDEWCDAITEKSDGRITFTTYYSCTLLDLSLIHILGIMGRYIVIGITSTAVSAEISPGYITRKALTVCLLYTSRCV